METQEKLRKLIDAIKQTLVSELSLKVNEYICGHYNEAGYRIGITRRAFKGTFRGYPICASYLPYQTTKGYACKIRVKKEDYVLSCKTAEKVTKILEEKYYKAMLEKEEGKLEQILEGKKGVL